MYTTNRRLWSGRRFERARHAALGIDSETATSSVTGFANEIPTGVVAGGGDADR